ncbi:Origin recognition complex, subunit 1 [Nowakowskiella sp. JEL0407]|nr:Origin recognition complex, subunit 1 [Nowakowskiella sp. JEL0407]
MEQAPEEKNTLETPPLYPFPDLRTLKATLDFKRPELSGLVFDFRCLEILGGILQQLNLRELSLQFASRYGNDDLTYDVIGRLTGLSTSTLLETFRLRAVKPMALIPIQTLINLELAKFTQFDVTTTDSLVQIINKQTLKLLILHEENIEYPILNAIRNCASLQAVVLGTSPSNFYGVSGRLFYDGKSKSLVNVLVIDELDILTSKKHSILYNFFEWANYKSSKLFIIAIANTMDLPERYFSGKIVSRIGQSRINFKPYTHQQLLKIITNRLEGSEIFEDSAVELCARKVGAVSGDARRALDICCHSIKLQSTNKRKEMTNRQEVELRFIQNELDLLCGVNSLPTLTNVMFESAVMDFGE